MKLNKIWMAMLCCMLNMFFAAYASAGTVYAVKGIAHHWVSDQNGCKVANFSPQEYKWMVAPGLSVTWSGDCQNGYASGKGTLIWLKNGKELKERFDGEMLEGERHKGTFANYDGTIYVGEFFRGERSGIGTQTWPEGSGRGWDGRYKKKYEGTWNKDGTKCGKIEYWDGDSYDGCFDNAGAPTGLTNFQQNHESQAQPKRDRCEHLYIGKAVRVRSTDKYVDFEGVVLGFSPKSRRATVKYTEGSSYLGTKEVDCGIIKD